MVWIAMFSFIVSAGPAKKAAPQDIKIQESYSVASLGLEAEAYRIQALQLAGKTSFMVAKLVNGQMFLEKPTDLATFKRIKKLAEPLLTMPTSEDCKVPMRVTFSRGAQPEQLKVCNEVPQVGEAITQFMDAAKSSLQIDK